MPEQSKLVCSKVEQALDAAQAALSERLPAVAGGPLSPFDWQDYVVNFLQEEVRLCRELSEEQLRVLSRFVATATELAEAQKGIRESLRSELEEVLNDIELAFAQQYDAKIPVRERGEIKRRMAQLAAAIREVELDCFLCDAHAALGLTVLSILEAFGIDVEERRFAHKSCRETLEALMEELPSIVSHFFRKV